MEQLALPPHTSKPPGTDPGGFDVDAAVAELKAKPKQDYRSQWTTEDAPPATEVKDTPAGPDAPTSDGPAPDANADASAREFIEAYDILQCYSFSAYSNGMDAQKFALPKFAKDRAAHHLAKGLQKMGSPELPWWVGLLLALAPPGFLNWQAAREYRKAQESKAAAEAAAARNRHNAANNVPLTPSHITKPNGQVIHMRPATDLTGKCQECGKPIAEGKKYCGQACAGKGSARTRKPRPEPTTP